LLNQPAQEDAETVFGSGVGILHAVAAQPAYEEDRGNLAGCVVWAGDEGSKAFAMAVLRPSVKYFGVLKVLTRGLGRGRLSRQNCSGENDNHYQSSGIIRGVHGWTLEEASDVIDGECRSW
jgi:hypothetical protein